MPLSARFEIRTPEGLQRALIKAAERNLTSASEYARQAILKQLRADGYEPQAGHALVHQGDLVRDREGIPVQMGAHMEPTPGCYSTEYPRGCEWLPIFNVDTEPFDSAKHYRLPPTLRVNGDHVQRVYRVIRKEDDR